MQDEHYNNNTANKDKEAKEKGKSRTKNDIKAKNTIDA